MRMMTMMTTMTTKESPCFAVQDEVNICIWESTPSLRGSVLQTETQSSFSTNEARGILLLEHSTRVMPTGAYFIHGASSTTRKRG
jgi:hypothetical protein